MSVLHLPRKANNVEDALFHISMGSVFHIDEAKKYLVKYVHRLARLGVRLEDSPNGGFMVNNKPESLLIVEVMF